MTAEDGIWVRDNAIREAEIVMQLSHPNIVTTYTCKLQNKERSSPAPTPLPEAQDLVGPAESPKTKAPWQLNLVQARVATFALAPRPTLLC